MQHVTDVRTRCTNLDPAPKLSAVGFRRGRLQRCRIDAHRLSRGNHASLSDDRVLDDRSRLWWPASGSLPRSSNRLATHKKNEGGGHRYHDELAALGLPGATPGHGAQRTAPGGSV
jgi:hypothetical protein